MNELKQTDVGWEELSGQLHDLKFDAGKSVRYNSHLRSLWFRTDHLNKVITLFLGTSVAVSTIAKWPIVIIVTGLLTAFFSSLDIVIGFSEKARIYDDLYKKWCDYLHDLEDLTADELNTDSVRKKKQQRYKLEREEPDIFRLMERYSSAEEAVALGREVHHVWKLNFFERMICRIAG